MAERTLYQSDKVLIEEVYRVKSPRFRLWLTTDWLMDSMRFCGEYRYFGRLVKMAMAYCSPSEIIKLQALWEKRKSASKRYRKN